jgi:hypothetical protein
MAACCPAVVAAGRRGVCAPGGPLGSVRVALGRTGQETGRPKYRKPSAPSALHSFALHFCAPLFWTVHHCTFLQYCIVRCAMPRRWKCHLNGHMSTDFRATIILRFLNFGFWSAPRRAWRLGRFPVDITTAHSMDPARTAPKRNTT